MLVMVVILLACLFALFLVLAHKHTCIQKNDHDDSMYVCVYVYIHDGNESLVMERLYYYYYYSNKVREKKNRRMTPTLQTANKHIYTHTHTHKPLMEAVIAAALL